METCDVLIIGAGAAGMMCAIEAGKRARKVIILDHSEKIGRKILISGGGRCNLLTYILQLIHLYRQIHIFANQRCLAIHKKIS